MLHEADQVIILVLSTTNGIIFEKPAKTVAFGIFEQQRQLMSDKTLKRLPRLAAIMLQLQTKKVVNSTDLSAYFGVSIRTIYRDIRVLEEIGMPILTEEGKGYSLMEGYKIPPVMFSETEANALATVGQLLQISQDSSLAEAYKGAVNKVKAVLHYATKDKIEMLAERVAISPFIPAGSRTDSLTVLQQALTGYRVLHIVYQGQNRDKQTERAIEPFAFYYSAQEHWTLIAYCRLRKDYRMFRLDRIITIQQTELKFKPHQLTLQEYLAAKEKNFSSPDKLLS